jgi:capsular polysaccharide biosynthesis protein
MKQDENLIGNDNVRIKKILNIPIKKKRWFIGAFLIVFLSGILFSFLRAPLYGSGSSMTVTNIDSQVYKNLWEFFPEDADKLAGVTNNMISENLISEGIRSSLFLDDVSKKLSFNISKKDLKNAIYTRIEGGVSLIITVVYSDPNQAYEINKTVFDQYLDKKNSEITSKPDLGSVYKYYDIKRDLIFSFFLSIVIGLLVAFIVNYIQSVRIKKNNK